MLVKGTVKSEVSGIFEENVWPKFNLLSLLKKLLFLIFEKTYFQNLKSSLSKFLQKFKKTIMSRN